MGKGVKASIEYRLYAWPLEVPEIIIMLKTGHEFVQRCGPPQYPYDILAESAIAIRSALSWSPDWW